MRDDEPETDRLGLRLEIISDPGADFRYDLSFEITTKAAFTDEVRTHDGLKIIIPAKDIELLKGATLDFTESQGLVIRNPNKPLAPSIEGLVRDDALSAEIEAIISVEVNPALAAHGGFVTFVGHDEAGTAFLTMGGGCHGCSMVCRPRSSNKLKASIRSKTSPITPAARTRTTTEHRRGSFVGAVHSLAQFSPSALSRSREKRRAPTRLR